MGSDRDPTEREDAATLQGAASSSASELPTEIGRYVVVHELGQGGMGVVLSAYDPALQRRVAIKIVRLRGSADTDEQRARLVREARAIARVRHPNVVHVYEVGEYEEGFFIAMEAVDGESLLDFARRARTLDEILEAYLQAGRGLIAAHDAGLIHRDFKPSNALRGEDGRVCVLDFGLARVGPPRAEIDTEALNTPRSDELTEHGAILGTPAYMSPEQLAAKPLDARTDQFSFCVALWEAIAGRRPFDGNSLAARGLDIAQARPADPEGRIPSWMRPILVRGLAARRDDRYPDMHALVRALERGRGRKSRVGLLAAGLVAAAGATLWASGASPEDPCAVGASHVDEVWSPARRVEIERALGRLGEVQGPQAARIVTAHFDEYSRRWGDAYRAACVAARATDASSETTFDAVASCLDRRLDQLAIRVQLLTTANVERARRATDLAYSLAPVAECRESAEVRRRRRLAPDRDQQAVVDDLLGRADRLGARYDAGERGTLLDEVETLVAEAEQGGHRPTLGELVALRATVRRATGDEAGATADQELALALAISAGDDRSAAELAVALAYGFDRRANAPESWRWIGLAESFAERGELGGETRARIERSRGELAIQIGRVSEGISILEELKERLMIDPLDDGGLQLALVELTLSRGRHITGDVAGALDLVGSAQARLRELHGEHHPLHVLTLSYQATYLAAMGRPAEALYVHAQHRELSVQAGSWTDLDEVILGRQRGAALRQLGRLSESREELERALAQWERLEIAAAVELEIEILRNLGQTLAELGELAAAEQRLRAAEATATSSLGPDHHEHVWIAARLGQVAMLRGDLDDAVRILDAALARADEVEDGIASGAYPAAFLAEALWRKGGADERAKTTATRALRDFRARDIEPQWAARLEQWMESPPRGAPPRPPEVPPPRASAPAR